MSGNHSTVGGIAGRYATALFDLAREADAIDAVSRDLEALGALIDGNTALAGLIRSPLTSRAGQGRVLDALLEKGKAHQLTRNFVALAATRRRLAALPAIIAAFRRLRAAHRGEVTAHVTSARALDKAQLENLRATLGKKLGGKVDIETRIDPSLLGGLIVQAGSRMIDGSLRTKLANLKLAMKEA